MISTTTSELLVVAVILAIGGFFWSQKPFWAKGLGVIAFLSAVGQAISSPTIRVLLGVVLVGAMLIKLVLASRKRRKKEHEERQQIHVHNYQR